MRATAIATIAALAVFACYAAAIEMQQSGEPKATPSDDAKSDNASSTATASKAALERPALIRQAVKQLVAMQEDASEWPYEGVYRVNREIPIGYRVGGTAIVASTLLAAASDDHPSLTAIDRSIDFVLEGLDDPLMKPSTEATYDVRIWGHAYALEFFCRLREAKRLGGNEEAILKWIPRLVEILIEEEISGGGWNYANSGGRKTASFVTAPVVQALLLARSQGEKVPDEIFERAKTVLLKARTEEGAFLYSGVSKEGTPANVRAKLPGSVARSAICETTLVLLGSGSTDAIRALIHAFYTHWDELEKRRQKTGTHEGPYQIAPYYFYYGHRYAAQAIEMLPASERPAERARLFELIMKTREADGTWNDRVFPRSKNYGTAMIVLALMGDKAPRPAAWERHEE